MFAATSKTKQLLGEFCSGSEVRSFPRPLPRRPMITRTTVAGFASCPTSIRIFPRFISNCRTVYLKGEGWTTQGMRSQA